MKALFNLSNYLEKGPVSGSVLAMKKICRNTGAQHIKDLKRTREQLVGDDTWILEDVAPAIDIDPTRRVELAESLTVLRSEFSEQQMTVFVLAEYERFKPSPEAIAELTSLLAPGDSSR